MLAPLGAPDFPEAVRAGTETYAALRQLLRDRGLTTGLGAEGGCAPDLIHPREALDLLIDAITAAGYRPGRDGIATALDPAASEFHRDDRYHVAGESLTFDGLVERYADLVEAYPIWSIEDGLAEDDWDGWKTLTDRPWRRCDLP